MRYFKNITDFEQAKKQYYKLAKKIHPDKGGSQYDFQEMQQEYQVLLLRLSRKSRNTNNKIPVSNILTELGELGKILLKTQIPQKLLKKKIKNCQNPYEKLIFKEIGKLLGRLS